MLVIGGFVVIEDLISILRWDFLISLAWNFVD